MKIAPSLPVLLSLAALLMAVPAAAQHDHAAGASPYTGMTDREIKALSAEEMEQLAARTITADEVRTRTARIGALRGELRAVHLEAHLTTTGLLSAEQQHAYAMLRGYHGGAHGGGGV